jgi:outer membrane receptor protein involved in Fe transport
MVSRTKRRPLWIAGLLFVLVSTLALMLQPAMAREKESEVVDLGQITVMAPQSGVEITTEKTIIRMDEFKKPGEVRTLTDVLTEIGGVDVQRINPLMASPGDEVSIRGLNEGRLVIEIDGRRINHTGHMGRYIVDWSTLNLDDVDRIEIIRGGHSVLHPFAIGGVINIITKKGKKTADLKPEVDVKAGYGEFETYNMSASINGGAANILGYNFSASKQETDGYLRNNFQETDTFNGHLTFYLPHEATFNIGAKYSDVNYGLPVINDPTSPDYDPDYPVFTSDADELRHTATRSVAIGPQGPYWVKHTSYLDGIFQVPVGPGTVKFHGFLTSGRRWLYNYNDNGDLVKGGLVDDETRGFIAEYRDIELFDSHKLTIGAEYQELGAPSSNPIIYLVKSAYIQDIIQLGERWKLTPGVRYYHLDMDTYYSTFGNGFPSSGKEQTEDGFYPSLKIDFQATPETALYAAVSRSYRLPCP